MSSLKKINLNSIADLRQAADENLSSIMAELGYDESFLLIDTKLGLGYLTVAIAAILFYLDKKYTFQETYTVTLISVIVYFVASGVLVLVNRQYPNVKYVGYNAKGTKITVAGWTDKYTPVYNVRIVADDHQKTPATGELPFNQFFDITGYLNRDAFKRLLEVEVAKASKKSQ